MKYLVKFEGKLVDTRNSDRTYTHAIVWIGADGKGHVRTFCGRPDLAQKELSKAGPGYHMVPVEVDAAHEAAKKPKTHRVVIAGTSTVMATFTSEKLALKSRYMSIGQDGCYAVEAI